MKQYFYFGVQVAFTLFALWVHAKSHIWMAGLCGDRRAAKRGWVAGNPFVRVDWIGTVLLPFFLILFAQPILGWSKPLALNYKNLRHPRRDGLLIAASGPAANLLLALAGIGVFLGLGAAGLRSSFLDDTFYYFCWINVILGIFNLLPIPPLDGGTMGALFLRGDALKAYADIKPYGFILLLIGAYAGFFDFITEPLTGLVLAVMGF